MIASNSHMPFSFCGVSLGFLFTVFIHFFRSSVHRFIDFLCFLLYSIFLFDQTNSLIFLVVMSLNLNLRFPCSSFLTVSYQLLNWIWFCFISIHDLLHWLFHFGILFYTSFVSSFSQKPSSSSTSISHSFLFNPCVYLIRRTDTWYHNIHNVYLLSYWFLSYGCVPTFFFLRHPLYISVVYNVFIHCFFDLLFTTLSQVFYAYRFNYISCFCFLLLTALSDVSDAPWNLTLNFL